MAQHPNVAIVTSMYECFNRGELDTIRNKLFAKDLVWNLPGRHPLAGTKCGAEEVIAFFNELVKSNIKVDLVRIDAWGDDTVVEVHRGHGRVGDAVLDALNCTHYRIKDGKIAEVQVYMSDQYGADNFFSAIYEYAPIPQRLAKKP
ncbi:MAG TPA: nuclear transport factor 2 family protein [Gemmataceae bacterium]|nr:nuclear transport factor 2 family protein [Gemmataceae bacterium]